jgi:hypothetical protein
MNTQRSNFNVSGQYSQLFLGVGGKDDTFCILVTFYVLQSKHNLWRIDCI